MHTLRVDGRACRRFRSDEAAAAVERMEGMLPWNGKADNMIDRFDGRALLDFYRCQSPAPHIIMPCQRVCCHMFGTDACVLARIMKHTANNSTHVHDRTLPNSCDNMVHLR